MATAKAIKSPSVIEFSVDFFRQTLMSALNATTSWMSPAKNPFDTFGVVIAGQIPARPRNKIEIGLTVQDARARLSDYLKAQYKPKSLGELLHHMRLKGLKLEARSYNESQTANYIVDQVTRHAIPASLVDASLTSPGLTRKFGKTLEDDASIKALYSEETAEQRIGRTLGRRHLARLRAGPNAFEGWENLSFVSQSMFNGRSMTIQGNEVWFGREIGVATTSHADNIALIKKLNASGRKIVVPAATHDDAVNGRLVPGMPILMKDESVRGRFIDPNLSYEKLSESFGQKGFDFFKEKAEKYTLSTEGSKKVLDLNAFRRRKATSSDVVQYVVDLPDHGGSIFYNIDGKAMPLSADTVAPGRYEKRDQYGNPSGNVLVSPDGEISHLDQKGLYHNMNGPAIIPSRQSKSHPQYVIHGDFLSYGAYQSARQSDSSQNSMSPKLKK